MFTRSILFAQTNNFRYDMSEMSNTKFMMIPQ